MSRSLAYPLAACLVLGVRAQVPTNYLVTAETGSNTSSGMRFVDPATGVATDVRPAPGTRTSLPRAQTVTIDPNTPASIPYVAGISTSIAPVFQRAAVQDNQLTGVTNHAMQSVTGLPKRLEYSTAGMLATIGSGNTPGLWLAPTFGGAATLLAPLAAAYDVATFGTLACVNSYTAGRPTQIEAVDLTTGTPRTLGTSYPPLQAMVLVSTTSLLAGTDTGDILSIDAVSGQIVSQVNLFSVAVVALTMDANGRVYALTAAREVWDLAGPTVPVYRASQAVNDIAAGIVDLASFLVFGGGCGQTGTTPMYQAASGAPSLGNAAFAVALIGGRPQVPAVFALGTSRTSWLGVPLPLPLDFLGMTGCRLYADLTVTFPLGLDGNGNGSFPLPVPNAPRFLGRHFATQWFAVDLVANPAGAVASDGGEGIIR